MKHSRTISWLVLGLPCLVALWPQVAAGQFRERPDDPVREAVADDIRREGWHREMRRLEFEEEQTKRWAAGREADLRAEHARLEDRARMNNVLLQQYQVAGEQAKARQLEAKVQGEQSEFQARREAFQAELEERMTALGERREQLRREFAGEQDGAAERPVSRTEHLQAAVRHLAQAAEHFEAAGLRRQAEAIRDQLRGLERELTTDQPARRPDPEQPDSRRLIETIERLHERMERMEDKLERLDDRD